MTAIYFCHTFFQKQGETESESIIRGPYNFNKDSRYVELVLVFDNSEYKQMGENKTKVFDFAKTIANIVNSVSIYYRKMFLTDLDIFLSNEID